MSKNSSVVERGVYYPSEIQQMLGISKTSTYKFLEASYRSNTPFVVIKIGKLYRVPKESFDRWYKKQINEDRY